jgi:hypothetical protein
VPLGLAAIATRGGTPAELGADVGQEQGLELEILEVLESQLHLSPPIFFAKHMLKKVDGTQFLQLWVMSIMKWPQQLGSWTFCPQPATMKQKKIKSITLLWAGVQVTTGWTAAVPKAEGGSSWEDSRESH